MLSLYWKKSLIQMIITAIAAQEVKRSSAVNFLISSILCDTEP